MPMESPESAEVLRARIDRINLDLLQLLSRRSELVVGLSRLAAVGKAPRGRDEAREQAMLARILEANSGPLRDQDLTTIFRAVFAVSLDLKDRAAAQGLAASDPDLGK